MQLIHVESVFYGLTKGNKMFLVFLHIAVQPKEIQKKRQTKKLTADHLTNMTNGPQVKLKPEEQCDK